MKAYTQQNVLNTITTNTFSVIEDLSLNGRILVSGDASLNGRLFVGGNVGIGAAVPLGQLHLYSTLPTTTTSFSRYGQLIVDCSRNGAMGGTITVRNSGGSGTIGSAASIAFELDGSTAYDSGGSDEANARISCVIDNATNNPGAITFNTWNGSSCGERVRISGVGYLGIGTTNPVNVLQIACNSSTSQSNSPDGGGNHGINLVSPKTGTTPYSMSLGVDYTTGCGYINAAGNTTYQPVCLQTRGGSVGIGTTNPQYGLDVNGRARISTTLSTTPLLTIGNGGTLTANTGLWCDGQLALTGRLYFYYNWCIYAVNGGNMYFNYSGSPETSTGGAYVTGGGVWTNSDLKFKNSINDIVIGLKEVLKLRPVTYILNAHPEKGENLGFVAQELQEQIPLVVEYDKENDGLCVNYTQIIPVLTKAIQEQNVIIQTQQSQIQDLHAENADLKSRLADIEARLTTAGF